MHPKEGRSPISCLQAHRILPVETASTILQHSSLLITLEVGTDTNGETRLTLHGRQRVQVTVSSHFK